jgi:hypothetical protein
VAHGGGPDRAASKRALTPALFPPVIEGQIHLWQREGVRFLASQRKSRLPALEVAASGLRGEVGHAARWRLTAQTSYMNHLFLN